jgi:hypothetical protein
MYRIPGVLIGILNSERALRRQGCKELPHIWYQYNRADQIQQCGQACSHIPQYFDSRQIEIIDISPVRIDMDQLCSAEVIPK